MDNSSVHSQSVMAINNVYSLQQMFVYLYEQQTFKSSSDSGLHMCTF